MVLKKGIDRKDGNCLEAAIQNYCVLFVDDEPLVLEIFKDNFQEKFIIKTACCAQEALEIVQREKIALILADQRMPGMTGTEFFAEIQKTHPEIIRILVTGYVDLSTMIAAINAGHVYHYVEKPWDDKELQLTIRRGLEHFHLTRERDRLQAERIQTLENMARSNRLAAVGTLAAGIAHEIRNPLSAIITFHQMIPEKIQEFRQNPKILDEEFWTRFAQISLGEVERIKNLIQELLDFSRDSGHRYQLQRVGVVELMENILPIIESDLRHSGIDFVRDFPENLPPIEVDPDKIRQVIINLLLNSMHATSRGGKVTLGAHVYGENVEIFVRDTGCGIDPEDLERVFDPFFTTRDPGLGTGLGLTMCHHIVLNHGGKMTLESEPGKGTLVNLRFPYKVLEPKLEARTPGEKTSKKPGFSPPDPYFYEIYSTD
jgi:signal transduction histidine kinase